jgi:hypothetical protein
MKMKPHVLLIQPMPGDLVSSLSRDFVLHRAFEPADGHGLRHARGILESVTCARGSLEVPSTSEGTF